MREVWSQRTPEERGLFNPAFIGALVIEFVKEYQKSSRGAGAPLPYVFLATTVILHKMSRDHLPGTTVSSMYEWIKDNEELLISLDRRLQSMLPYVQEAVRFSISQGMISFSNGHRLVAARPRVGIPASFIRDTTQETKNIVKQIKFLSRWFAKSGSEVTVLAGWGVSL